MTEVRWAEQAADDLAAILEFIRCDSPAYAHLVRRSAELLDRYEGPEFTRTRVYVTLRDGRRRAA